MVLYLPLYQQDGAMVMSRDAYGNAGTAFGTTRRPDGHYFDGIDDYLIVPDAAVLKPTQFTVMLWLYPTKSDDYTDVVRKYDFSPDNSGWRFCWDGSNPHQMYFSVYDTAHNSAWTNPLDCSLKQWHFLAGTCSTAIRFWVDMVEASIITPLTGEFGPAVDYVHLMNNWGRYEGGVVSEFMFYNRPLSPVENERVYCATRWRYQ